MSAEVPRETVDLIFHFRKEVKRTNLPDTCLWCGKRLRTARFAQPDARKGDYQDGAFCGLRCGYMFGVWAAKLGFRLEKREDS